MSQLCIQRDWRTQTLNSKQHITARWFSISIRALSLLPYKNNGLVYLDTIYYWLLVLLGVLSTNHG